MEWWDDLEPSTPDDDPVAPDPEPVQSAEPIADQPMEATEVTAVLPEPVVADVALSEVGEAEQAGETPIELVPESRALAGRDVQVEVLDQTLSQRAGVRGFAFRLRGGDGEQLADGAGEALPATVTVDYSSFKDLYGAGYGDRLGVVALPECAFADPVPADCDTSHRPLEFRNNRADQTLIVDVDDLTKVEGTPAAAAGAEPSEPADQPEPPTTTTTTSPTHDTTTTGPAEPESNASETSTTSTTLPEATAPGPDPTLDSPAAEVPMGDGAVLAVMAGPEGEQGSFEATQFSLSGDWQVAVGSGEFSWNYDFPVPAAPAGPEVKLDLGYSSGSVDSMVTTKNTQASQVGLGWGEFDDAYIERRYNTCRDDYNPDTKVQTDDLCWARDNASISLNGQTSELVAVPGRPGEWRLKADPRWKVERLTKPGDPAWNSDNDGEHWKVTAPDGVQYWFGLGRGIGGWETGSTWTVPVVGDDAGEPCKGANQWNWCDQAWRWNLDRVVDPNGNTQVYLYEKEFNNYAAYNGWAGLEQTRYVRSGYLTEIQAGRRLDDTNPLSVRVKFQSGWRCSWLDDPAQGNCPQPSEGGTGATYPDTPLDLLCATRCTTTSPTFFSSRRYKGLTVETKQGATWNPTDSYSLAHSFQDPDPNTTDDSKLFLTGIQRTGQAVYHDDPNTPGNEATTPIKLPATNFLPTARNNRYAPAAGESAMPHWRIGAVVDEYGRQVTVTYGQPHPCQSGISWDTNSRDCFPQMWAPEGQDPTFRAFNKYVVTKVDVKDTTGGSPTMTTTYAYGDQVGSGLPNAAWHHDNDDYVPQSHQSFSEWRGYSDVTVTQGASKTRYRVFRGMNGDRQGMGQYKTVRLSSLDGTVTNVADENWLAGRTLDEVSLRPDGSAENGTVHRYQSVVTANEPDSCAGCPLDLLRDARWVGENDMVERLRTPSGAYARKRTLTLFDATYLFPTQVREHGWTDQTGDERCTRSTYAVNAASYLVDFPATQTRFGTVDCSGAQITRTETAYDSGAVGAAPTKGNATLSRQQITASPVAWAATTTTHDFMGRPLEVTDPNGHKTTTTYGSTGAGFPIAVDVTNHMGHKTRTEFYNAGAPCEPCVTVGRQLPAKTIDANGNVTTYRYDALGRVSEARQPTEQTAGSPASYQYFYDIHPDKKEPAVIRTRQLQDTAGSGGAARYSDSWVIYDSLLRERQTHAMSPASGRVIVANTVYDGRGLVTETNVPEDVAGTAGNSILAAPSGGWANRTITSYDHVERPIKEDFYAGSTIERPTSMVYTHMSVEVTPPRGGKTLSVTDAFGREVRVEEHDGTAYRPTINSYDSADRLTSVTDPAGNKIAYSYDMAGRRIASDDSDAGAWTYGYDPAGNQTRITDAAGAQTHTVYDAINRPTELHKDSPTGALLASWSYDATGEKGLLDKSTRHDSTGNWVVDIAGYDPRGRPKGTTWTVPAGISGLSGSYSVSYGYDAADHETRIGYPAVGGLAAETVTTKYNSLGLPEAMAGVESYVYATGYDGRARPTLMGMGSNTTQPFGRSWTYNKNQELATVQSGAQGGVKVQDLSLVYDKAGNITERTASAGDQKWRECFGYDERQRLRAAYTTTHAATCASGSNKGTGSEPYNHTYSYTVDGNLKTRTEGSTAIDYTYPASGADSVRPHAPTAVGSDSYTWDANGQQATRKIGGQTETLTWGPEHRLAGIDDPDGDSSFIYDADGNRLLRRTPQGTTLYIGGHEITVAAGTSNATAVRSYSYAGAPVATRDPQGVDYLADDNQGSIQLSVPSGSTTATVRTHQPYGKPRHDGDHATNRGWIGQIEDQTTGLDYLNARYYDPATAVFLAPDPLLSADQPKSLNAYSYAFGNPTTNSDPGGEAPCCLDNGQAIGPGGYDPISGRMRPDGAPANSIVIQHTVPAGGAPVEDNIVARIFFETGGDVLATEASFSVSQCPPEEGLVDQPQCTTQMGFLDPEELLAGLLWHLNEEAARAETRAMFKAIISDPAFICGALPICGEALDAGSAIFYAIKGDWEAAGLSTASLFAAGVSYRGMKSLDALSASGRLPAKGGRTQAGRVYQKHMDRGELPHVPGRQLDVTGQDLLDDILTSPGTRFENVTSGNFKGGYRFVRPDGVGATFDASGTIQYFGQHSP